MNCLLEYDWPGNVRELENVIRRVLIMARGPIVLPSDLPPKILGKSGAKSGPKSSEAAPAIESQEPSSESEEAEVKQLIRALFRWARRHSDQKLIQRIERELVAEALRETRGNQVRAAALLGMTRATLRKRMEQYRINPRLEIE